ncbi:MAG: tRNA (guanosine(37)-N1)-methyltransferase TrmD [Actinomycetaceae bacterium]|nr:tRNA (guanosine(37)-N1)-methyltransferase TrmD [Actinomycetaceae bacterium]
MRFDLVSIFPKFFDVLDLSLMGKAKESGALQIAVHDLRDWTQDRHRTVDDTPYGGGAGMVMRPDIWGKALDDVIGDTGRVVLAVPTPSGKPLLQNDVRDLARADQIVIACGRYEGIDQRVVDHYRSVPDVEVFEYSIGEYVLNGGEVAAVVLVEAISRLLDGFMGNPESLTEESFEGNVVEYPAYTRPPKWRGLEVPEVLQGGNHAAIEQWRRGKSLERTARVRPDLINKTDPSTLSIFDREVLARFGWLAPRDAARWDRVTIRPATQNDVAGIARVAEVTFPDACPPDVTVEAIREHVENNLSEAVISGWIDSPRHRVMVADFHGEIAAYAMIELFEEGEYPDDIPAELIEPAPTYVSKVYTLAKWRGSGLSGAIMEAALADAEPHAFGTQAVLGTNVHNKRARKFYRRHDFKTAGRRTFDVAGIPNEDVVMVRTLRG